MRSAACPTGLPKKFVHDVQAHEPKIGMPECLWNCADDGESKRLPQPNGRGIGLHDGVELHSQIAVLSRDFQYAVGQSASDAAPCRRRRHHETCVGDVTASGWLIGMDLRSPDDQAVIDGDQNSAPWLSRPPRPCRLLAGISGPAVGVARRHDRLDNPPQIRPVGLDGVSYLHSKILTAQALRRGECWTCDVATVPEEVNRYLRAVTAQVRDVFGDRVIGVYTTGSLALGGYRPGRSDIDLMAVVSGSPALDLRRQLAAQLDHRVLACPAAGLEFVLYPEATVRRPTVEAGYLLNFNTGPALPPVASFDPGDAAAFWYPIDRAITYQSGGSLYGPCPAQLFAELPFDDLLQVVIASVEAHSNPQQAHLMDNAVLNGCRALSFAQEHRWYTKVDAAERNLSIVGEFAPLVSAAITSFRSGREDTVALDQEKVRAFLCYVLQKLMVALRPEAADNR
jgi:hypothetical protein